MKTLLVAICMMCVLPQLAGLFVSNPLARIQHIEGRLTALHASVVRPTIFEEMKYEQLPFRAKTEVSYAAHSAFCNHTHLLSFLRSSGI
jgi:hypothetical protein